MPEGPEAVVTADLLNFALRGSIITAITYGELPQLRELLPLTIKSVFAHAKKIVFTFNETSQKLIGSLGMTGQFFFRPKPHTRFACTLDGAFGHITTLYFVDVRGFGGLQVCENLPAIAPCVTEGVPDVTYFARPFTTRKNVASVLLDQQYFASGIGNYLMAETLYHSRINPFRVFSSLSTEEKQRIFVIAAQLAQQAILKSGMSFSDFISPFELQGDFAECCCVYGRQLTPNGHRVQQTKNAGRTVWWVPELQH